MKNSTYMKRLYLSVALLPSILLASITYALAQTTYFYDQYGMPTGSATQSGSTTYFNNNIGMPTGIATRSGNTIYTNDSIGMPTGTATITTPYPVRPVTPIKPIQPYGR